MFTLNGRRNAGRTSGFHLAIVLIGTLGCQSIPTVATKAKAEPERPAAVSVPETSASGINSESREIKATANPKPHPVAAMESRPKTSIVSEGGSSTNPTPLLDSAFAGSLTARRLLLDHLDLPRVDLPIPRIAKEKSDERSADLETPVPTLKPSNADEGSEPRTADRETDSAPKPSMADENGEPGIDGRETVTAPQDRHDGEEGRKPENSPDSPPVAQASPISGEPENEPLLEITDLQICQRVRGFGDYDALEHTRRVGSVFILYCELSGVRHEPVERRFRSRLSARLEMTPEESDMPIWTHSLGEAIDICRHPRKDYFVGYPVHLPRSLPPGRYRIKLVEVDLLSGKEASRSIPIVIRP